ncbi:DUF1016 N-terminal domain-containing protein [Fibrella aestuarina]|uniref:DUF1016 N-terminal domain-containing protein n=1 Tax=Fibrella aestuarina TaxID=651143 RepID=UPI0035B5D9F0
MERQKVAQWGDKVTAQLAADLQREFPEMKGLSHRNIKYMKQFAATYPDFLIGQRPVAQLPWAHHVILLDKVNSSESRAFYTAKALENGWSRDVLSLQIKSGLHEPGLGRCNALRHAPTACWLSVPCGRFRRFC